MALTTMRTVTRDHYQRESIRVRMGAGLTPDGRLSVARDGWEGEQSPRRKRGLPEATEPCEGRTPLAEAQALTPE